MANVKRNCDNCNEEYYADTRNLKRGWGLCCSKSCAASKREKSKPGYNSATVAKNNEKRANWFNFDSDYYDSPWMFEDDQSWDAHKDTF